MARKKKKEAKKLPIPTEPILEYEPDPLVTADNPSFTQRRVFTVKNESIQYMFREHFLYFPFENKHDPMFSTEVPPACFHLEKRSEFKDFNFFEFRKSKSKVNLYRFARQENICEDLLHYISDGLEVVAKQRFQQKIEELRESKQISNSIKQTVSIPPLFDSSIYSECHFYQLSVNKRKSEKTKNDIILENKLDDFLNWFNNLNDPLVNEIDDYEDNNFVSIQQIPVQHDLITTLTDKNRFLVFDQENTICIRNLVQQLISYWYSSFNVKFKFGIAGSPGLGKTRLFHIFSGIDLIDLDDWTMLDRIEGPLFHKLVNNRNWNQQRLEYHRVIRTRFKQGIILCQNPQQLPADIPYVSIITPGHLNRRKLWSDRGLYDLVRTSNYKIYINSRVQRNALVQIIYEEIFNSSNYVHKIV